MHCKAYHQLPLRLAGGEAPLELLQLSAPTLLVQAACQSQHSLLECTGL